MRQGADASVWDEDQARSYAENRHGPDGKQFLDPSIHAYMDAKNIRDQNVLDIGCGTGPWSLLGHVNGARSVTAFDLNKAMTDQARKMVEGSFPSGIPANILIEEHDANALPAEWEGQFNRLISINVGCNLANLEAHFREAYRVATSDATMLVTAPNSLGTVFTDGEADGIQEMLQTWSKLGTDLQDAAAAKKLIAGLQHVRRATFRLLPTKELQLLDSSMLKPGEPVIRRIPGLAVDNNVQTPDDYKRNATKSGWLVTSVEQRSFADSAEHTAYNQGHSEKLGAEYVKHAPFFTMTLLKK